MAWSLPPTVWSTLHRAKRLAQFAAQTHRCGVQGLEYRFLACSLLLRFRQRVTGSAVHRLQADHVLAAQPGNRAGQHGLAAGAQADLVSNCRRQTVTRRTAHQLQCLVHLVLGSQIQKWRLLKLYRQTLLQRVVEYAIACRVGEIGKDNGVFVGQWLGSMRAIVKTTGDEQRNRKAKREPQSANVVSSDETGTSLRPRLGCSHLLSALRPLSVSRFSCFRSERISDASW